VQRSGHHVKLLHPADVARYRDGNKTERADVKALLEAVRNQALTPVPVKSVEQQAVVALRRIRQGLPAHVHRADQRAPGASAGSRARDPHRCQPRRSGGQDGLGRGGDPCFLRDALVALP
jgi:hypothetical protein